MRTSARFDCDIEALSRQFMVDADTLKRKIALDIYGRLLATTPRDTSRAAAGWSVSAEQAGAGVPPKGLKSYNPNPSPSIPKNANIICIYNNVEYIIRLNEGHSKQAPAMFVEQAVDAVMGGLRA